MKINHAGLFCSAALLTALAGCSDASDDAQPPPGGGGDTLSGSIDRDTTLSGEWTFGGIVFVEPGVTLTIEPGTVMKGAKVSLGTIVVKPGARLVAQGTADNPIVFTSQAEPGDRRAGDWGGVILLGKAPINVPGGKAEVEGISATDGSTQYGGSDPDDSSGVLEYVRIEYSGVQLTQDNEINGLTMAGVGRGTTIDHVMVHHTTDDCFEFFGGTVDAKHLVCAYNGDDGFDWDFGYTGRLQYLAVVQDPAVVDDANGFEADNDADSTLNEPISDPTIYNVSLCGQGSDADKQQYGLLLRRSTRGTIANALITGFEACVDVRNETTSPTIMSSICANSTGADVVENIAYAETGADEDDDGGLDEVAWFNTAEWGNSVMTDPMLSSCFNLGAPDFHPASTLSAGAATPPDDGFFDASAAYIGAFTAEDTWATGAWISFEAQ